MTSKEALDKVARYCSDMRTMGKAREELTCELDIILQDLERLEVLEKENQELHQILKNYVNVFGKIEGKNLVLQQENEKLKMAIEIIKDIPMCVIDILRFNNYFVYREFYDGVVELSKGDFDLLKEVLSDDK